MTFLPRDIVFVHIPKTAGTSLRAGLSRALPNHQRLYDYGPQEALTSKEVRALRYSPVASNLGLRGITNPGKPIFLMGHLYAIDYLQYFAQENFVAFVRDPVERVVSEFKHFARSYGFRGGLMDFARNPAHVNKQSNYLRGLDLESMGFLGVSENLEDDLFVLSRLIGVDICISRENTAPRDQILEISNSEREAILSLNRVDRDLYERAMQLRSSGLGRPSPKNVEGHAAVLEDGSIQGWVVADEGTRLFSARIEQNGHSLIEVVCDQYRQDLFDLKISCTGLGGFRVSSELLPKRLSSVRFDRERRCFEAFA